MTLKRYLLAGATVEIIAFGTIAWNPCSGPAPMVMGGSMN
jgi:hypothetical protein